MVKLFIPKHNTSSHNFLLDIAVKQTCPKSKLFYKEYYSSLKGNRKSDGPGFEITCLPSDIAEL